MSASGMSGPYLSGEVQRLLGVGEHVLRYWERALPILSPARSFGRRQYSCADVALLLRVRHLVRDRGLGLGSVLAILLAERGGSGAGSRAEISATLTEARVGLIQAYFSSGRLQRRATELLAADSTVKLNNS